MCSICIPLRLQTQKIVYYCCVLCKFSCLPQVPLGFCGFYVFSLHCMCLCNCIYCTTVRETFPIVCIEFRQLCNSCVFYMNHVCSLCPLVPNKPFCPLTFFLFLPYSLLYYRSVLLAYYFLSC